MTEQQYLSSSGLVSSSALMLLGYYYSDNCYSIIATRPLLLRALLLDHCCSANATRSLLLGHCCSEHCCSITATQSTAARSLLLRLLLLRKISNCGETLPLFALGGLLTISIERDFLEDLTREELHAKLRAIAHHIHE